MSPVGKDLKESPSFCNLRMSGKLQGSQEKLRKWVKRHLVGMGWLSWSSNVRASECAVIQTWSLGLAQPHQDPTCLCQSCLVFLPWRGGFAMIGELYSSGSKLKSWDFSLNEHDKSSGIYNSEDWQMSHVPTHRGAGENKGVVFSIELYNWRHLYRKNLYTSVQSLAFLKVSDVPFNEWPEKPTGHWR